MIKAVIFDMDGVLIDSEPLWQEAEIAAFARVGVHLTRAMCMETMGLRVDEVIRFRYEREPWSNKSLKEVETEILDELEQLIATKGRPMAGVDYILDYFRGRGIRMALASSSYLRVINAVLDRLDLHEAFEIVHSGEFEERGKPDPAIYLSTLRKLNLAAQEVIAIEDSYNGILSARSAGLRTLAIPEHEVWSEAKYDIAELKLKSLLEFNDQQLHEMEKLLLGGRAPR